MNVSCTSCSAKYAIPDEKVRGKKVKITCKHCSTGIIVDTAGNVWTTNNWKEDAVPANPGGHQIVAYIGAAAPVPVKPFE